MPPLHALKRSAGASRSANTRVMSALWLLCVLRRLGAANPAGLRRSGFAALLGFCSLAVQAIELPRLTPWGDEGETPHAPWRVIGLPMQSKPFTKFSLEAVDGRRALRMDAESSYGNLVHPLHDVHGKLNLTWEWRVDKPLDNADPRKRSGDDAAAKVCAMFDLPDERVPFFERQMLHFFRSLTLDPLPAATLCYLWDPHLPAGTQIDNPYTRRIRYWVLQSGASAPHEWRAEQRDLEADFLHAFGDEAQGVPPLVGIAVGADSDSTRGHSIAHVAGIVLGP